MTGRVPTDAFSETFAHMLIRQDHGRRQRDGLGAIADLQTGHLGAGSAY